MEKILLKDGEDYILRLTPEDTDQGYEYCKYIYEELCRKYPKHRFAAIPSNYEIEKMDMEGLKYTLDYVQALIDQRKEEDNSAD